jgi:hypothetical protein
MATAAGIGASRSKEFKSKSLGLALLALLVLLALTKECNGEARSALTTSVKCLVFLKECKKCNKMA